MDETFNRGRLMTVVNRRLVYGFDIKICEAFETIPLLHRTIFDMVFGEFPFLFVVTKTTIVIVYSGHQSKKIFEIEIIVKN